MRLCSAVLYPAAGRVPSFVYGGVFPCVPRKKAGQLRQQNGTEHERTAEQLATAQTLAEKHPARKRRKHGFKAHHNGSDGRLRVFLRNELKRKGHAA